ncbi:beta-1,3-galactosyltransferase GALT1 [Olea europaea subsp. europaea]|uniref:Beta-1,3-galactosyltransferase GALT1 n=1 Tax=Olea europaea subsp. europaea TaxID=158383 RepID=A0A8S0Q716_OLEEU|nr:beta-1,3-galactosyltransferase GALT1 [Olea europaea subsp. europaea]
MKKWYDSVLSTSLLMLLVLGYYMIINPIKESYIPIPSYFNTTNPLEWINPRAPPALYNPVNASQLISTGAIVSDLFAQRNLSNEELNSLHTWNRLKHLISHAQGLPNAIEAIKEASVAWSNLMSSTEEEKLHMNGSTQRRGKEKQCSSITIIGIPNGLLGNFRIDLTGGQIPPIILHYNLRLQTVDGKHITSFGFREHKNQMVNEELWNEARTYKDNQLMPFVDYYSLITWKTIAICIFGTGSFSKVFQIPALTEIQIASGILVPRNSLKIPILLGHMVQKHKKGDLKTFKLEDVATGIWISDMKKSDLEVRYEKEDRIFNEGCKDGYVIAH